VSTAGARWVERYLRPLLAARLIPRRGPTLRILQLDPDDDTEAARLRADGHSCDVVLLDPARVGRHAWQQAPSVRPWPGALAEPGSYDFVLTGYFGRIGGTLAGQLALAREVRRVCVPGGAFLTAIGNRRCPVDFTGNAPRLHRSTVPTLATLPELEGVFVAGAGFAAVHPLSLTGHFGMSTLTGAQRIAGTLLEWHWRTLAVPERRWVYASAINPTLMVWVDA
jgi:hypothetical protein